MHPVNGPANLKSAAVPVPRIIGGTLKLWTVWSPEGRVGVSRVQSLDSGYAHSPLSPKFLMDFCLDEPYVCTGQI